MFRLKVIRSILCSFLILSRCGEYVVFILLVCSKFFIEKYIDRVVVVFKKFWK